MPRSSFFAARSRTAVATKTFAVLVFAFLFAAGTALGAHHRVRPSGFHGTTGTQNTTPTVTTTTPQATTPTVTTTTPQATTPTVTATTPQATAAVVTVNVPVPSSGAYWGEFVDESIASVGQRASQVGRSFGIAHFYNDWYKTWGGARSDEKQLADSGTIVFDHITPRRYGTSEIVRWAQVANGSQDSRIDQMAGYAKSLGHPMFIGFHVEPETDIGVYGTAADYVAAYRHLVQRFTAQGATNVSWVWQTEGYSSHYAQYAALYPGDDVIDWIAWDPYNWYTCHSNSWQSFAQVVQPFYSWLQANGHANKPFMLGEYGSPEAGDGGTAKRQWFLDALKVMKAGQFPNLKALVYFDSSRDCSWRIDTSPTALDGFAQMGADNFFHP